jgi:NAD(P)H dehydrogenase (quinone)
MDRILITAATGSTGNATAKLLLERGLSLRALVRKEDERSRELVRLGAGIVTGNLRDFDSLRPAMKDVSRAYFVFPIGPGSIESTAYFAQAAVDAGMEAIVNSRRSLPAKTPNYPTKLNNLAKTSAKTASEFCRPFAPLTEVDESWLAEGGFRKPVSLAAL